ncbi:MAG: T9SS type A sorting domain-containing protein [Candidatus Kapabacteria bacterium]|nr:T9SS type A sorting domain-containing protein [Candidatus Kapabacteria bacterium]
MTSYIYKLFVFMFFPVIVVSQGKVLNESIPAPMPNHEIESIISESSPYLGYDKDISPLLMGKYKELDIAFNLFSNTFFPGVNPFVYEPKSGTLILAQSSRARLPEGSDTADFTGFLYLYTSQDGGENWQKHEIYRKWGEIPTNPSVAVLNPNNSTDPADFLYVINNRYFTTNWVNGVPVLGLYGCKYLIFEGNNWNYLEYDEIGPLSENPGNQQRWTMTNNVPSERENGNWVYTAGILSPVNEFSQYGSYGVGFINIDDSDVGSSIPEQFRHDKFRPSAAMTSSYQGQIEIDVDPTGNVYTAVNNYFLPYEEDGRDRVVGVAKSVDNGKTYGEFNKMSKSILEDFITFTGGSTSIGVPMPGNYPYSSNGFKVVAEDEYSFIYRIISWASTESSNAYIVEAFRKDGQWGLRQVSTFKGRIPYVIQDTSASIEQDVIMENSRQHELQLSMTADGQYLVAKWIDFRDELVCLEPPVSIIGSGILDSILSTDIFISYRPVNGTQWSAPQNLTDDIWFNKCTYIPTIIPSLNNIPILENITVKFTNPSDPRYNYPYFIQNYVVTTSIRNHILVASYDAMNPETIGNPALQRPEGVCNVSSVNEENYNFRILSVSPNPIDDEGYINYQLDHSGLVTMDIYNSLGQKILNVRNQFTEKGLWQANFSAANLPTGTYYCTLNFNGYTLTKALNVVR